MEKATYFVLGLLFYIVAVPLGLAVFGFMLYASFAILLSLMGVG